MLHCHNLGKVKITRNKIIEYLQLIFFQIVLGYFDVFDSWQFALKCRQAHKWFVGIRTLIDNFCRSMPMSSIMQLILHDFKEKL